MERFAKQNHVSFRLTAELPQRVGTQGNNRRGECLKLLILLRINANRATSHSTRYPVTCLHLFRRASVQSWSLSMNNSSLSSRGVIVSSTTPYIEHRYLSEDVLSCLNLRSTRPSMRRIRVWQQIAALICSLPGNGIGSPRPSIRQRTQIRGTACSACSGKRQPWPMISSPTA